MKVIQNKADKMSENAILIKKNAAQGIEVNTINNKTLLKCKVYKCL